MVRGESMLRRKFRYTDYERLQENREYTGALRYCASFPHDDNAAMCGVISRYCQVLSGKETGMITRSKLDEDAMASYRACREKGYRGCDKDVMFLFGVLLFECDHAAEGSDMLVFTASTSKKGDRLSAAEKKARFYLEEYYFQKWLSNRRMSDLKQAADCFGHSEVCYLYADMLLAEDGDRDTIGLYNLVYAADYCAAWVDPAAYRQKRIENRLDQIGIDIREDFGSIVSDLTAIRKRLDGIENYMKAMSRKMDALPAQVCDAIQSEFEGFRVKMSELSLSNEEREDAVRSLVEAVLTMSRQQGERTLSELEAIADQIKTADRETERCLNQVVKELNGTVHERKDESLREIIKDAEAEIRRRFQGRLSEDAEKSIVTALFTLNFYKKLNSSGQPLIEYSGVVILATSALEIELHRRLYAPYVRYIADEHLPEMEEYLTLGSLGYIVGIKRRSRGSWDEMESRRKENYQRFVGFLQKHPDRFVDSKDSLFSRNGAVPLIPNNLRIFVDRLYNLSKIRNRAAHADPVALRDADTACSAVFLSPLEHADKVAAESISLLEWLVNSCK